jgi:hypothetical protein
MPDIVQQKGTNSSNYYLFLVARISYFCGEFLHLGFFIFKKMGILCHLFSKNTTFQDLKNKINKSYLDIMFLS